MGFLDRIKKFFNLGLNDPKAWNPSLWRLAGSISNSGENVNESTALTYSAVWDAVNLISGTIASLPLHLMQRKGSSKQIVDDRRLYRVMHDQANPYMTAMTFRKVLMAHVLTWGNGYAEIVRNGYGDVVELWPITPDRITPEMRNGVLVYRVRVDSQDVILPFDKVLHVLGPSFDGFTGYSVIGMARKGIGLSMAMESFGELYFGQGTHPGVIVSHPSQLTPDSHTRLKDSLSAAYSGLGKAHRLMLLEDGMKIEKIGIPPNDSQFLESRQFQIPEIARWFNLPPHKLKDLTKSSFSNIESEQISFVTDSILPWLVLLEQFYAMKLLSASDKSLSGYGRLYFKHIVEGLLRGDAASRSAFYTVMLDKGVMSINEVREKEDMDPITGGDEHFVPLNMVPLSMVKEQFKQKLNTLQNPPKQIEKKEGEDNEVTDDEAMV